MVKLNDHTWNGKDCDNDSKIRSVERMKWILWTKQTKPIEDGQYSLNLFLIRMNDFLYLTHTSFKGKMHRRMKKNKNQTSKRMIISFVSRNWLFVLFGTEKKNLNEFCRFDVHLKIAILFPFFFSISFNFERRMENFQIKKREVKIVKLKKKRHKKNLNDRYESHIWIWRHSNFK